jgi:peptidoglycan/LPS O-acetylase OafA/YrhL
LRALAVAGVAWHHWRPGTLTFLPLASGVQLFFVLSGFLITGILLDAKERARESGESRAHVLKAFYVRRFLRIFPLYYGVLIAAAMLNVNGVRESFLWHFCYLSNYYFIWAGGWNGPASHFWTLAVEEQFYLVWPILILFAPTRRLPLIFVLLTLSAPVYRIIGALVFSDVSLWGIATPGSLDSLSIGAMLAYLRRFPTTIVQRARVSGIGVFTCSLACYILVAAVPCLSEALGFLKLTLISLLFASVIGACTSGLKGIPGKLLECSPMVYLGTISYGLYVFHNFAGIPMAMTFRKLPFIPCVPSIGLFLAAFWTILAAAASWHLYELPINRLKKRFPYVRRHPCTKQSGE